jgi:toluene monooxygenase system ferredoxin subunit
VSRLRVAPFDSLWDGEMRGYVVSGRKVLLVRLEGAVFAYEDRCAHLGLPLSDGRLDDGVITCSAHHYRYCARTGSGVNPRSVCLRAFAAAVEDGFVCVDVDAGAEAERRA